LVATKAENEKTRSRVSGFFQAVLLTGGAKRNRAQMWGVAPKGMNLIIVLLLPFREDCRIYGVVDGATPKKQVGRLTFEV
jgi:hypothetical protein